MASFLIADTDLEVLWTVRTTLATAGHTVATTNDAESATRLLASGAFDCALVNVELPSAVDVDLARRLRDQVRRGEPRLGIMVSAGETPDTDLAERVVGADLVVERPLSAPAMVRALGRLLNLDPSVLTDLPNDPPSRFAATALAHA